MSKTKSWEVKPPLDEIKQVMDEVGAARTVLAIYFRQPFVLDEASGLRRAGAIIAHFSVSDTALMDVLTGRFRPRGKLPFALANNLQAVIDNDSDVPGYPGKDTLYPFGFGLTY
jgi:beta-glucosidase